MPAQQHPEIDGQAEQITTVLHLYLPIYCNYQENNWVESLSFADFIYNNSVSPSIDMTPFFVNYGYHPS